jgi:7-cyano-7-deazaguanine synthase in queuosine biosynthesis
VAGEYQPLAVDLIRIATFVYAADTSVSRGGDADVWGDHWARNFFFHIPVLEPDRWSHPLVTDSLIDCLSFLTGDSYQFEFHPWTVTERQEYLRLFASANVGIDADCVCLFSGGLDSLCAAAILAQKEVRRPLLISHHSATRLVRRRRDLVAALRERVDWRCPLWSVEIHRVGTEAPERTQRSRAFLYAALGTAAALALGLRRINMSDNGIASLNIVYSKLGVATQLTRSTHPGFLSRLNKLLRALDREAPTVENTLLRLTKADVMEELKTQQLHDLVPLTISCSRPQRSLGYQPHCGTCSQCIDRRFAIEHARLTAVDPPAAYAKDVFLDALSPGAELTLAETFVRWAGDVSDMSIDQFVCNCAPLWDAVLPEHSTESQLQEYYQLHRRHADQVLNVWSHKYAQHKTALAKGTLPPTCLLRLVPGERVSPVERAARGIATVLQKGLPKSFQTTPPTNERAVQDAVDAVLAGYEDTFRREHPTIRFAAKRFTPDFSPALQELSIEVKFPTRTRKPTAILNEMIATASAHRAAGRSILFVIYDHHRMMTNEDEIRRDLEESNGHHVFVTIIR